MAIRHLMPFNLGPLRIHPSRLEAPGDMIPGHQHNRDHVTMVRGNLVRYQGPEGAATLGDRAAYPFKLTRAEDEHSLTHVGPTTEEARASLEGKSVDELREMMVRELTRPVDVFCVFAHYDADGKPTQEYDPWNLDAYGSPRDADPRPGC